MTLKTRIKMCGMTQAEDVVYAQHLGVDALGFIFYNQSRRAISVEQAKAILVEVDQRLSRSLVSDLVAVFVNPERSLVAHVMATLPIDYLQFHGEESPEFCNQFAIPYIKAIPAESVEKIQYGLEKYATAAAILLDTPAGQQRGGTGQLFDWEMIPKCHKPMILAGGLTVDNVWQAIRTCSPSVVDVCSGIESSPGIKDHTKMQQFVEAVRGI